MPGASSSATTAHPAQPGTTRDRPRSTAGDDPGGGARRARYAEEADHRDTLLDRRGRGIRARRSETIRRWIAAEKLTPHRAGQNYSSADPSSKSYSEAIPPHRSGTSTSSPRTLSDESSGNAMRRRRSDNLLDGCQRLSDNRHMANKRKPARTRISVQIPPGLRTALEKAAAADRRKLSSWVVNVLADALVHGAK